MKVKIIVFCIVVFWISCNTDEHNNANLNVIDITKFKYEHNSLISKKYEKVIKQIKNDASFLIYSNIYSDEVTKSILPLDDSI